MNILIVEDEVHTADFLKDLIEQLPDVSRVETAYTIDEAFTKATAQHFNVTLTDIKLDKDGMSGIEFCRSLYEQDEQSVIMIISALQNLRYIEEAFRAGAIDYITKPFRPQVLQARVKRWTHLIPDTAFSKKVPRYAEFL